MRFGNEVLNIKEADQNGGQYDGSLFGCYYMR
jgi:hypothetical protein